MFQTLVESLTWDDDAHRWDLVTHRGDRIRTQAGEEVYVSRIEAPFLGRPEMIAFIEDTPERWHAAT